jgi:beta-glucosidase
LEPGASETLTFTLRAEDFRLIGRSGTPVLEPGAFRLQVDTLEAPFSVTEQVSVAP